MGDKDKNFREIVHFTVQSRKAKGGISGSGAMESVPLCRNPNTSTEYVEGLPISTRGTLKRQNFLRPCIGNPTEYSICVQFSYSELL
jgi:hypothetical protein